MGMRWVVDEVDLETAKEGTVGEPFAVVPISNHTDEVYVLVKREVHTEEDEPKSSTRTFVSPRYVDERRGY